MPKLLLVEDNVAIRDMLTRRLVKKGFVVVSAIDGVDACAKARSERPDLILMDMHLPLLDGWEAARQLKTTAETARIPIIALTADAMAGDREKALEAGCDDYETKPVELPNLLLKIDQYLNKEGRP